MIKFMVDSSSDCFGKKEAYDYFVPMTVTVDGKDYLDGEELSSEVFYGLLTTSKEFPKTSQPSPQAFLEYFEQVKETGDELICFCVSSACSGTYQSALMAKEMVEYDRIYVIDTALVTHLIGVLVLHGHRLREQGCTAPQIVHEIEKLKTRVKVLAGVDTLEYLRKGGRIGGAAAFVGSMAQIKPILTVEKGRVEVCGKAIGKARVVRQITDMVKEARLDPEFPVWSLYSFGEENCEILENKLEEAGIPVDKRCQIGPTIGAHTGPGVCGVIFVTK